MQAYVIGFLLSEDKNKVALVRKDRPEWQAGHLNGIGGKIEAGERPGCAMTREFREEAGVFIKDWEFIGNIIGTTSFMYVYQYFSDEYLSSVKTMESEEILTLNVSEVSEHSVIDSVQWIIPYILHNSRQKTFVIRYDENQI